MMKYDCCDRTVSNTLYEVGGKKFCAIHWLGEELGSDPKYWKMDANWTVASLKSWKAKPWHADANDLEKSTWKWSKKDGWALK